MEVKIDMKTMENLENIGSIEMEKDIFKFHYSAAQARKDTVFCAEKVSFIGKVKEIVFKAIQKTVKDGFYTCNIIIPIKLNNEKIDELLLIQRITKEMEKVGYEITNFGYTEQDVFFKVDWTYQDYS